MFTGLIEEIGTPILLSAPSYSPPTTLFLRLYLFLSRLPHKPPPPLPSSSKELTPKAISTLTPLDPSSTGGGGTSLTITSCPTILSDAALGDSISINGTCLTITELLIAPGTTPISPAGPPPSDTQAASAPAAAAVPTAFKVGISPETLRRTNLGTLVAGGRVNLERAARADARLGGHLVQGHVDCVARIVAARKDGNSVVYRFEALPLALGESVVDEVEAGDVGRYIVEKGYVALDGTSLTVTATGDGGAGAGEAEARVGDGARDEVEAEAGDGSGSVHPWWEVMLIPYTRERVVMGAKGVGDLVNVEVDMVGKYVERSVRAYLEHGLGLEGRVESMVRRVLGERGVERGLVEG